MRVGRGAAFADDDQADARLLERLRLTHDLGQRVVRLAVGEHDQHAVGRVGGRGRAAACPARSTLESVVPPSLARSGSSASRYIRIAPPSTVSGARM